MPSKALSGVSIAAIFTTEGLALAVLIAKKTH
jgi:hypothetical protein